MDGHTRTCGGLGGKDKKKKVKHALSAAVPCRLQFPTEYSPI